MKKTVYILFCLLSVCLYTNAQSVSIIDDLNTTKSGQGKIVIYQDEAIKSMVGRPIVSHNVSTTANNDQLASTKEAEGSSKTYIRAKGYRIQVYAGNDQKRSKNEAQGRRSEILSVYPNMEVSVSYTSPVWKVKAGNFKTREQATEALNEMKSQFPGFGREMHVISDAVNIAVD